MSSIVASCSSWWLLKRWFNGIKALIGFVLGWLLTAELEQNKEQNQANDNDLYGHDDLSGSGSELIPGFSSGAYDAAALGITEAKYI